VFLLSLGVGLANWRPAPEHSGSITTGPISPFADLALGFFYIITAALLSGFSSVFMEALSKGLFKGAAGPSDPIAGKKVDSTAARIALTPHEQIPSPASSSTAFSSAASSSTASSVPDRTPVSVFVRNVHLATVSIAVCTALTLWDAQEIATHGLTKGYTPMLWLTLAVQALGGMLVAWVIHHSNNIFKCFLSAASIVLTVVVDAVMGEAVSPVVFVGCMCVTVATVGYVLQPKTSTGADVAKPEGKVD